MTEMFETFIAQINLVMMKLLFSFNADPSNTCMSVTVVTFEKAYSLAKWRV